MYSIKKQFKFEYSHRLWKLIDTTSPCRNIHGHSGVCHIEIAALNLNQMDMITDFTNLKHIQKWLDDNFDHAILLNQNDTLLKTLTQYNIANQTKLKMFIMRDDPTAESMSKIIFEDIVKHMLYDLKIEWRYASVTIYETVNNCATYLVNNPDSH